MSELSAFRRWLRIIIRSKQIDWITASMVVRSPFVRIAAAIPTLGYFVLYGDAFSGMFDFSESLGATHFMFEPAHKVRLVYYGAVLIGAALFIYVWRCPKLCQRLPSTKHVEDEFMRTGGLDELFLGDFRFEGLVPKAKSSFADIVADECALLTIELEAIHSFHRVRSYKSGEYAAFFADFPEKTPSTREEVSNYICSRHTEREWDKKRPNDKRISEDFIRYYNNLVQQDYYDFSDRDIVKLRGKNIATAYYDAARYAYPYWGRLVQILSMVGLLLAALPALDVLLQVVLTDTGLVGRLN